MCVVCLQQAHKKVVLLAIRLTINKLYSLVEMAGIELTL
jgi:hypothetical protein